MAEQIYGLIGKAMSKIRAIGKDDTAKNMSGKVMYKFRGIDAVYNALNPIMAELGLFIIPEVLNQTREERKSVSGGTLIYSILTIRFTMYAPDGSSVSGVLIGEGMDSGDKASNKAMSIAMKYFCFQTFMIPTEDITDPDSEVHEVQPKQATTPMNENPPAENGHVETSNKLPSLTPALNYVANEQAYMAEKLGIDAKTMKARFQKARTELINSGAIENIAPTEMTMEQAKSLVAAVSKVLNQKVDVQ